MMSKFLKGNFEIKNDVTEPQDFGDGLEEKFEREVLKRLGGSMAFVSKKKFVWQPEDSDEATSAND